jgi:hypothetical protein
VSASGLVRLIQTTVDRIHATPAKHPPPADGRRATSVEANKQLYRRWLLELWNGNLAITDQIVTPDFVGSWPGRPGLVHGPKELAEIIRMSRAIFSEVTFAVEVGPVADGELVAARWIGQGRYQGHAGRQRARWYPG